ncbi:MAG TPA: FAD-binding and (Fe-S)-binding domain-containing protein [Alphaproteobacteria bacterium]|nr:FAD-binding and (Fe-S)-binding domain-containing protein [Alphaproteobacteria bacterium]
MHLVDPHGRRIGDSRLARRLARETGGEVLFDAASRGRYATDASIYQVEPIGVLVPRRPDDVVAALAIAREEGLPVLPRGAGTSQSGQAIGEALIIDTSKHLDQMLSFDPEARRVVVEPGLVLDDLNRLLKPHGLWFPVDISTASRATLGGMAGNNACGSRSLHYGNMMHNVHAIDAVLVDGREAQFGPQPADGEGTKPPRELVEALYDIARRHRSDIAERFPKILRSVAGYNLASIEPGGHNLAHLLIGSEGTLAYFQRLHLDLQPLPQHKVLGICHFPTMRAAMTVTPEIVALGPVAVELVDRTMIDLARHNPLFAPTIEDFFDDGAAALLLVEFAGDELEPLRRELRRLRQLMADLGHPDGFVEALDPGFQADVWEIRKAGLNILMAMKGDGKPISFIEDCAVPLEHLADYTDQLSAEFARWGVQGTWYAHASVGCLHVRPVLNLKQPKSREIMRAIADKACSLVAKFKGAYSGEHGDGLVRSEFLERNFGPRLVTAFSEVKESFDPEGLMNPGKIVWPTKMDDHTLFRYGPHYQPLEVETALDWSDWGGLLRASEMCNNNGACRKSAGAVMCPSFRATGDEQHLTRGRANTLRLALSGQLGGEALQTPALRQAFELCLGCKGCRRECPTGVDMARMKIEVLAQNQEQGRGPSWRQRLIAGLPRYAPQVSRLGWLLNLAEKDPVLRLGREKVLGFSRRRRLPQWHRRPYVESEVGSGAGPDVALFVDCFHRWFEPDIARAAHGVLSRAGCRVWPVRAEEAGGQPLCCGRTYLTNGRVGEARAEARRLLQVLRPLAARGIVIVGLEPSCLLTLRDEYPAMLSAEELGQVPEAAKLLTEFIVESKAQPGFDLGLKALPQRRALVHGHCHEAAFGAVASVTATLDLIPGLTIETTAGGCCGMAGAFGYEAEHAELSQRIAEQGPLPAVREAAADTLIVADGTSCRSQFRDLAERQALHVAEVLALSQGAQG